MISNYKEVLFDYEQLETKNLILRKFKKSDVEDVYEYGSDKDTVKYLVWDAFKNIDDAKASIINYYWSRPGIFAIELKEKA